MKTWILGALLAGALLFTVVRLFDLQFAAGEVYPEYSSLRTDPKGARLLYDSLASLPGITVERNYRALEFLPDPGVTVVLIAIPAADFGSSSEPYLRNLEASARRGNRMVAALTLEPEAKLPKFEELSSRWNVQLALDDKVHRHSLYFSSAAGWEPLVRLGSKQMVIERAFGKGSIVLFAGSSDFTNLATVQGGQLNLIARALGSNPHIIFDEQHLGIAESGSVVALARRFHLLGMAFGLALCAALLLWRNGVDFPPPVAARAATRLTGRTSHAGLVNLLRRHIPPNRLAGVCWQEWFHANRGTLSPLRRGQAEAILAAAPGRPLETLREIQAVLHAKGEL